METWLLILIIVLSSVVVLSLGGFFGFCFYISSMMANKFCKHKNFKTREEKIASVHAIPELEGLNEYQRTPINFTMPDSYIIHGDYSLNNPKKFVICMHGHTGNREGCPKYSYSFYRLGYSLVFIDHRSHGENVRSIVTMGIQEHKDALEVIKQVKAKFGQDIEIGLFGCSMGGATALMTACENQELSFVVSDCAFASLENLVRGIIKAHKSPYWPILPLTEHYMKKRYGVSFKESCPKERLKNNKKVPILFIQGQGDDLVYPYNAQELYDNDAGEKEIVYFEHANHCGSVTSDRERYYKVIEDFIKKYGGKK